MTVQYRDRSSVRLLFYWFGSVWQNVWHIYAVFSAVYLSINLSYRFAMDDDQQKSFDLVVGNCNKFSKVIPITFLLGFYVSSIVRRWWEQLCCLVWPDKTVTYCCAFFPDTDHKSTMIRRTIARYCNLMCVLVWKEMSIKVHKRFPTDGHLLEAGLITEEEFELYSKTAGAKYTRWFVPVSWAVSLLNTCLKEKIVTERGHQKIIDEIYALRDACHKLAMYDWVQIPLVYTQVVTAATYGYFTYLIIARQSLIKNDDAFDYVFTFLFTSLELIFYIGWLKVGEELRCPFGEDEEDFDMNYFVDRNLHVSMLIADDLHKHQPALTTDRFYRIQDPVLPHTFASAKMKVPHPHWSLYKFRLSKKDQETLTKHQENYLAVDEEVVDEQLEESLDRVNGNGVEGDKLVDRKNQRWPYNNV